MIASPLSVLPDVPGLLYPLNRKTFLSLRYRHRACLRFLGLLKQPLLLAMQRLVPALGWAGR